MKGDIELRTAFMFAVGLMAAVLLIAVAVAILTNTLQISVTPG